MRQDLFQLLPDCGVGEIAGGFDGCTLYTNIIVALRGARQSGPCCVSAEPRSARIAMPAPARQPPAGRLHPGSSHTSPARNGSPPIVPWPLEANPELAVLRLGLKRRARIQPYQLRHEVPGADHFLAPFTHRHGAAMPRDGRRDRRWAPPFPRGFRAAARNPIAGTSHPNSAESRRARFPRRWHAPYAPE